MGIQGRVEAPIVDHLRNYAPDVKKYKVVQYFPIHKKRNQEDCKFLGKFIPYIEITMNF